MANSYLLWGPMRSGPWTPLCALLSYPFLFQFIPASLPCSIMLRSFSFHGLCTSSSLPRAFSVISLNAKTSGRFFLDTLSEVASSCPKLFFIRLSCFNLFKNNSHYLKWLLYMYKYICLFIVFFLRSVSFICLDHRCVSDSLNSIWYMKHCENIFA